MTQQFANRLMFVILLICQFSICLANENPDANNSSKYLDAVREFADKVLEHGRDKYGPKHTPLFVDGLMVRDPNDPNYGKDGVFKPVEWIAPSGEKWVLSNLASQQNLFRTLDGLTKITGDPKYKQAAMDAIKYAFENLRAPNGLLYWGDCSAYDALGDKVRGDGHVLKSHDIFYELMWEMDTNATKDFIESFWAVHILDWSNLDMNRIGYLNSTLSVPKGWNETYKGGHVFFDSWPHNAFINTGTDLFHAAAFIAKRSGEKKPLVWAKRLAYRYVETRHPSTGISKIVYNQGTWFDTNIQLLEDFKEHFVDPRIARFPPLRFDRPLFPNPNIYPWISYFLVGEMLGSEGEEFTQWALEELTAWGKVSYRKRDNSFVPILTDGTSLEGYVFKTDGFLGSKGMVATTCPATPLCFWAYSIAYRLTGDDFMLQMVRDIAQGNHLGEIGVQPGKNLNLNIHSNSPNPYLLLGLLELYQKSGKIEFLEMARRIGNNILNNRFHKGFFALSKKHIYARLSSLEPLALLHLHNAVRSTPRSLPRVWPSISCFTGPYRDRGFAADIHLIYTLTDLTEPPVSLQEAAFRGNINKVRSLITLGADVNAKEMSTCWTALHRAAIRGHKDVVELLLVKGADIDAGRFDIGTALHRAAISGHKDIVELLLAEGANIDARDLGCVTPLHYAAQGGHKEIAELLIDKGANVNAKNNEGQTPLDVALNRNRKDIVELLLARGAEVSSIHAAVRTGDLARVKTSLENGADINEKDKGGVTPLHVATDEGYKSIAEWLINKGAHIDAKDKWGYTSLYDATRAGEIGMVEFLIAKGADVNAKDNRNFTPLHSAVRAGHKDIVELLIAKGADINTKNNEGQTPVDIAVSQRHNEVVGLLIAKGADPNTHDESGNTLLHIAADRGHKDLTELLITKGADVNAKNNEGQTPVDVATSRRRKEIVELLIAKGVDVSSIHLAAYIGDLAKVKAFIQEGIDINTKMRQRTPLHYAAREGRTEIVELLLENGADVNAGVYLNRTAAEFAMGHNHNEIVELLVSKGADIPPLHLAIYMKDEAKVRSLIAGGADVNKRTPYGTTPLDRAIFTGLKSIVELLIEKGADVNAKDNWDWTPLHSAIYSSKDMAEPKDMVELLMAHDANVNAKDGGGRTPLWYAQNEGHTEIVELLRKHGAKESGYKPRRQKRIPINKSFQKAAVESDIDKVKSFISKGADLNAYGWEGTALHIAAQYGHEPVVQLLIDSGANVNVEYHKSGDTPLHYAAACGRKGIAKILIEKGADVKSTDALDHTPLHFAASGGHRDVAELLIAKGAEVNAVQAHGLMPLHESAKWGHKDVAELLINSGANVNAKDKDGRIPLWYAKAGANKEIVKIFPECGPGHDVAIANILVPSSCTQGDSVPVSLNIVNRSDYSETLAVTLTDVTDSTKIGTKTTRLSPTGIHGMDVQCDMVFSPRASGRNVFGGAIDGGGDVNGDGYDDLLITGCDWNGGQGRAYLYHGGKNMDNNPDKVFTGQPGEHFGDLGCSLGDVNGDGFADVIIGVRGHSNNDGQVHVYHGGSNMDTYPDIILEGEPGQTGWFGIQTSVADIDRDGYEDILATALGVNGWRGRAYLFYGGDSMSTSPAVVFEGERAGDWYGRNAVIGDDVDGDGFRDILIGARRAPEGKETGRAYLFYGDTRQKMNGICDMTFIPPPMVRPRTPKGVQFGSSLDICDIDNDGYADVVIGSRTYAGADGAVFIYWGNKREKMDAIADVKILGEKGPGSQLGGDELLCADFNGDNYKDIVAGAYNWFHSNHIGRAYLHYGGKKDSIDTKPDKVFTGDVPLGAFGHFIGSGDFNNDGYVDLVAGAWGHSAKEGRAFLYYGDPGESTQLKFDWNTPNASPGEHILKATIDPVAGEEDVADNTMSAEVEVKKP